MFTVTHTLRTQDNTTIRTRMFESQEALRFELDALGVNNSGRSGGRRDDDNGSITFVTDSMTDIVEWGPVIEHGTVICDDCGDEHVAEFSHMSRFGDSRRVYAVVCDKDWLTGYYMDSVVNFESSTS